VRLIYLYAPAFPAAQHVFVLISAVCAEGVYVSKKRSSSSALWAQDCSHGWSVAKPVESYALYGLPR